MEKQEIDKLSNRELVEKILERVTKMEENLTRKIDDNI